MPIPPQSILAWSVSLTVCHTIAIASTVYRYLHRLRQKKLWLDDYFASFSLFVDVMYAISLWLRYKTGFLVPDDSVDKSLLITLYWFSVTAFFCVIWTSRISLALSIARIFPPKVNPRRFTIGMAILFGVMWMSLLLQTVILCTRDTSWHSSASAQCTASRSNAAWITALVADILADVSLVVTPLVVLWRVKLPKKPRRLVLSAFAASIWTCLASIAVHVFLFGPQSWGPNKNLLVMLVCHIEKASISLLVCNLLIVVTVFYRHKGEDLEEDTEESTPQPHPNPILNIAPIIKRSSHRMTVIFTQFTQSMVPSLSNPSFYPSEEDSQDGSGSGKSSFSEPCFSIDLSEVPFPEVTSIP